MPPTTPFKIKFKLGGASKPASPAGASAASPTTSVSVSSSNSVGGPTTNTPRQQPAGRPDPASTTKSPPTPASARPPSSHSASPATPIPHATPTPTPKPSLPLSTRTSTPQESTTAHGDLDHRGHVKGRSEVTEAEATPAPTNKRKAPAVDDDALPKSKIQRTEGQNSAVSSPQPTASTPVPQKGTEMAPVEVRSETPIAERRRIAIEIFTDKSVRVRSWKCTSNVIRTIGGGEMEIPLWTSDEPAKSDPPIDEPQSIATIAGDGGEDRASMSAPVGESADDESSSVATPSKPPVVVHDPTRPHLCPYIESAGCVKAFPTIEKLSAHVLTVHGPKTYACESCPKKFPTQMQLVRHRKTHSLPISSKRPIGQEDLAE